MEVLRGGAGDLSLRLPYIIRPTGYILLGLYIHCAPFIHRPRHLAGSAVPECFSFDQYYIFIILNMIKIFNPNFSDYDTMSVSV
jgi:hypothetical protein